MKISHSDLLYAEIKAILLEARQSVYHAANSAMVIAYWEIGKRIVEFEQGGKKRADYGESLLVGLSKKLTSDFGKGFALASLKNYRQFYLTFSENQKGSAAGSLSIENKKSSALRSQSGKIIAIQKSHALRAELSWTHYRLLMRVKDAKARNYYIEETVGQNWSTRALERQINSFYHERILSSRNKKEVQDEARQATSKLTLSPEDFIKDPYVLEFLNIPSDSGYLEKDIEKAIIRKLQQFMLEMGKGFSFVAQQKRISAEDDHFYVDLVFYNYILKCFVLIDLLCGAPHNQFICCQASYVLLSYYSAISQLFCST